MRNSSRTWLKRENAAFAQDLAQGSRVLDAGAGEQPYRSLFDHCDYEAADFEMVDKPYAKSKYVCDLAAIPVQDGYFDAVLCNQVLEHVPEPRAVLGELSRVMKPDAKIILTAPLFYMEHEQPYDFFRYTQFAWRDMMKQAGFIIERIDWVEGYLATVGYQFETAARYLPHRPRDISPGFTGYLVAPMVGLARLVLKVTAVALYALDERHRYTSGGFPINYLVVARKGQ